MIEGRSVGAEQAPAQPAVRPGEVLAEAGRWNEAALRVVLGQTSAELTWTEGTLGFSISLGGNVVGRLNRHGKGKPWTVSLVGFERWCEPSRVITQWHYSPVWAVPTLRAAKREVTKVLRSLPPLPAEPANRQA